VKKTKIVDTRKRSTVAGMLWLNWLGRFYRVQW
jgi:hypothetical protein